MFIILLIPSFFYLWDLNNLFLVRRSALVILSEL